MDTLKGKEFRVGLLPFSHQHPLRSVLYERKYEIIEKGQSYFGRLEYTNNGIPWKIVELHMSFQTYSFVSTFLLIGFHRMDNSVPQIKNNGP